MEGKNIERRSYKYLQKQAIDIGSVLLEDGMLYGNELDKFLQIEANLLGITLEEEYNDFEECVLDYVQRHKDYYIIHDLQENKQIRKNKATEVAIFLDTTVSKLDRLIRKQILIKDRYKLVKIVPSVKDLAYE